MSPVTKPHRFVIADLKWLISDPTNQPSAGLTAFRQALGRDDLFSVYVKFSRSAGCSGAWNKAKIYALAEEMEGRLPPSGEILMITAGSTIVAEARITSDGAEIV